MTQSKIEEVAAALAEAEGPDDGMRFERMAKAAIEAMRLPTEAMVQAGFAASPHDVSGCRDQFQTTDEWTQEAVLGPYQAMLTAALKEGE
jgi:hypothetical protein